jgi:hypothetical protein
MESGSASGKYPRSAGESYLHIRHSTGLCYGGPIPMNPSTSFSPNRFAHGGRGILPALVASWLLATPREAQASFLEGEALDTVAEVMSWVVIVVVPVIAVVVFWLLHIMPEKIAEKRKHPQAKAIQCLCLLSLFFGGLLWPIAWLWAYSKPVLHKLAYGHDKEDHHGNPVTDDPPKHDPPKESASAPAVAAETSAKKKGGHA